MSHFIQPVDIGGVLTCVSCGCPCTPDTTTYYIRIISNIPFTGYSTVSGTLCPEGYFTDGETYATDLVWNFIDAIVPLQWTITINSPGPFIELYPTTPNTRCNPVGEYYADNIPGASGITLSATVSTTPFPP